MFLSTQICQEILKSKIHNHYVSVAFSTRPNKSPHTWQLFFPTADQTTLIIFLTINPTKILSPAHECLGDRVENIFTAWMTSIFWPAKVLVIVGRWKCHCEQRNIFFHFVPQIPARWRNPGRHLYANLKKILCQHEFYV